jgi:hypothetical protein
MGKLIDSLRQLIREEIAINEDRLGKGLTIADVEKAAKIKKLHPENSMVYTIIKSIEDATDYDMTRLGYKDPKSGNFIKGLSQILNMNNTIFGPQVRELIASGVIADKAETAIPKKERPEPTGQRGRKTSDKSKAGIIRILFQKWKDNPEFQPTDDDVTYDIPKGLGTEKLSDEDIAKTKKSALGLMKRGRKPMEKDENEILSKVNKALSEGQQLHEVYRRLQKIK